MEATIAELLRLGTDAAMRCLHSSCNTYILSADSTKLACTRMQTHLCSLPLGRGVGVATEVDGALLLLLSTAQHHACTGVVNTGSGLDGIASQAGRAESKGHFERICLVVGG